MNLAELAQAGDAAAAPWFVAARALQVDRWPTAWQGLAPDTLSWPLDVATVRALGRQSAGYATWFDDCSAEPLLALARQLDAAVQELGGRACVRLNSRSPKDALQALRQGLCVRSGAEALGLFLSGSRRCAVDLRQALARRSAVHMVVRAWLHIPAGHEFRCFMQHRRWVGTSATAAASLDGQPALAALQPAMAQIVSHSPVADAAFDLALLPADEAPGLRAVLLDANPLIASTDRGGYARADGTAVPFDGGWVVARPVGREPHSSGEFAGLLCGRAAGSMPFCVGSRVLT